MTNNSGPSTNPCGTLLVMGLQSEKQPFSSTLSSPIIKSSLYPVGKLPLNPMQSDFTNRSAMTCASEFATPPAKLLQYSYNTGFYLTKCKI
eukprot:g30438.t1